MMPLSCSTATKRNHLRGSELRVQEHNKGLCVPENSPNPSLMFLKQMLQDFSFLGVRCFCFVSSWVECLLLEKRFCQERCCIDLILLFYVVEVV